MILRVEPNYDNVSFSNQSEDGNRENPSVLPEPTVVCPPLDKVSYTNPLAGFTYLNKKDCLDLGPSE